MRKTNAQLKLIVEAPVASTRLTDTQGSPRESYYWSHMAAVRREWQQELWIPSVNPFDLPLAEILGVEKTVRKELYP